MHHMYYFLTARKGAVLGIIFYGQALNLAIQFLFDIFSCQTFSGLDFSKPKFRVFKSDWRIVDWTFLWNELSIRYAGLTLWITCLTGPLELE